MTSKPHVHGLVPTALLGLRSLTRIPLASLAFNPDMRRTTAIAVLFLGLCAAGFGQIIFSIPAPQDDGDVRATVADRQEMKPLQTTYSKVIQSRLLPLTLDGVAAIFGPALQTTNNWYSRPDLVKYPADLVLPIFAHGNAPGNENKLGMGFPGVVPIHPNHADLHAVGKTGYIEFYYFNGETVAAAAIFFRADDRFTPLKSTNDFAKRLEWDKAKFAAFNKWLDDHQPKVTDLGIVEFSAAKPIRVDLDGGKSCFLRTWGIVNPSPTNHSYTVFMTKEAPDPNARGQLERSRTFDRPGASWDFSIDGKFYRLTLKLGDQSLEPMK